MEGHDGAGDRYLFCTKSGMLLRYDVKNRSVAGESGQMHIFFAQHAKSSKIKNFRAGLGAAMLILAKCLSYQVQLRALRAEKCIK